MSTAQTTLDLGDDEGWGPDPPLIECYDALCMMEPWLELVMLGYKTLETRTKCMRKRPGELLLASSRGVDHKAWYDDKVGGLLGDADRRARLPVPGKLA